MSSPDRPSTPSMASPSDPDDGAAELFAGPGEVRHLARRLDWAASPLGPPSGWSPALRTMARAMFDTPFPVCLWSGPQYALVYNDAYRRVLGAKHPDALGEPGSKVWAEIWEELQPQFDQVRAGGESIYFEDAPFLMARLEGGAAETAWFSYSLSPLAEEDGTVAAVLNISPETTGRVLAEQRATTERERLFQAFEQAPGFIISMRGPNHRIEFVNAAHRQAFSSDDWVGQTIREAFPDIEGQGFYEMLDGVYATGERVVAHAATATFRQPDGGTGTRYLDFVYEALRDPDGAVVGVLCEGSDVTAGHVAREALRQSEARFRTALQIDTVGGVFFHLDGGLVEANDAFLRMSGYSRDDLQAGRLSLRSLTAPEWLEASEQVFADLKAGRETTAYEKEYVRKDGSRWWGLFAAKLLPDDIVFKFVVDITEQKRTELALREQTAALETLNRTAAVTATEKELDRIVQAVTDAGVELTGAEFGAFFYNVVDPDGESYTLYTLSGVPREAFSSFPMPRNTEVFAPTFTGEGVVRSDDIKQDPRYGRNAPRKGMPQGHLPVASYLAVPVRSRSGDVLGGLFFGHSQTARFSEAHELRVVGLAAQAAIAIDNAALLKAVQTANETLEQRVAERSEALTQAHEALRQAQKMEAVGQLTGGIAHDFNNLLMGISGSLEMIEGRLAQRGVEGLERFIHGAQSSARRAASLTQRLLAFSRRQTLDPKPTDINRLVYGMEDLIRRTVGPSIEVEVVGQAGLWPSLIDAAQLESALLNLAINARDAMPTGGRITIETANKWLDDRGARERELNAGQYLSVCVTDTGTGIPKEVVDRIFDPFFTTKPIGEGTGLGLSMVHGFVRQSGGQVRVYSEPGKGTTMCLYLPRYTGEVETDPVHDPAVPQLGEGETVLVIDDEPTVRMLIVEVLSEAGYHAIEAQDGPSGLKILQSDARIDLLITDVGLP
ncbi:MAG TPA: PAS domain S-box protein, partial [Caulobacteraceae bacterium]